MLGSKRDLTSDSLKTITEQVKKGSPLAELIGKDITAYSKRHEEEAKVLLNYLQRGKKRSCDGDRPLAKRQQPVQHGGVYGMVYVLFGVSAYVSYLNRSRTR